jgi:hypothetical protein
MTESITHSNLVKSLKDWIRDTYKYEKLFIWTDSAKNTPSERAITIEGFVPDVYARFLSNPTRIIGEAKTPQDLLTKRSELQISAFLRFCSKNLNYIFVLAVPWDYERYAKTMLNILKVQLDIKNTNTIVLERLDN